MKVVFISPHFPAHFERFCHNLARHGATVLGLGDTPTHTLGDNLRAALTDYIYVPNMLDLDAMQRAMGLLTHRHGKIDRIDSLNEHWLGIEAELRRDFNIEGLKPEDLQRGRGKAGMRQVFQQAQIPCAAGARASSFQELDAFARSATFPIVVKPDLGVGAVGAQRIDDPQQLQTLQQDWPGTLVAEEFLQGTLMSYDGLVDRHGRVLFEHCTRVNRGVMEIMRDRGPIHYYSLRHPPRGLLDIGRQIVQAFELKERFFHIEAFQLPDNEFRALEINLRPPGGFSTDMMNFACDIDVYELWARALLGHDLADWTCQRRYHCAHVGRRDHLNYKHPPQHIHQVLGQAIVAHQRMPQAFAQAMGDDIFLVRHPDEDELKQAIALIEEQA